MAKINVVNNVLITQRNKNFDLYLKDISKYDLLTVDEEVELFEKIKKGDNIAKNTIIECNQRFIVSVAKQVSKGNNDVLLDLINEGNIGLMMAIDKFDLTYGVRFLTVAVHWIHRQMKLFWDYKRNIVRKTNIGKTVNHVPKINNTFFLENSRFPTLDEVKNILKNKHNIVINDTLDLSPLLVSSIDVPEENGNPPSENEFNSYYYDLNDNEFEVDREYKSYVCNNGLNRLSERTSKIIRMYYGIGYDYEMTLQQISEEMGLTTERIRQIHIEGLNELREYMIKKTGI